MAFINRKTRQQRRQQYEANDPNRKIRQKTYQSKLWQDMRKAHQMEFPLCEVCEMEGKDTLSEDIHHLISPFKDSKQTNLTLAYDPQNLMSLCDKCHWRLHHGDLRGCFSKSDIADRLKNLGLYKGRDNTENKDEQG